MVISRPMEEPRTCGGQSTDASAARSVRSRTSKRELILALLSDGLFDL